MWNNFWTGRGSPWEHDRGPSPAGDWARLFAETPNYRRLGAEALGREKFRWHFGPMFYRGRLEGGARVLLLGQEGAQDESLAHRSFVGGSGARMQHFLRYLGITRSYLFLNSFIYPIYGQYDQALKPFAQSPDNPIVAHRHQVFEQALKDNDLRLVITVGNAAQDSLATWRKHRGQALPAHLEHVHVVHPGSAAAGGGSAVRTSFEKAAKKIVTQIAKDASWLPADADGTRDFSVAYKYGAAPIPFRDLPFGVCWRIGRGSTSSNRGDGQRSIQIFSADGKYNGAGVVIKYSGTADGSPEGYAGEAGDLPYEPPKVRFDQFDPGPSEAFARLILGGTDQLDWPDFAVLGLPGHPSFGFGPIYRGRFDDAVLYILADQDAPDDLFTARAYSGEGGQHLQAFLQAAGLARRYVVVRPLPVDTLSAPVAKIRAAIDHEKTVALHRAILQKTTTAKVILTIGDGAARLAEHINAIQLPVVRMMAWNASGSLANWNQALGELKTLTYPKELDTPSFHFDGQRGEIARIDLPYGTLRWQGSSGSRALAAKVGSKPSPDYRKIVMPKWAAALAPSAL